MKILMLGWELPPHNSGGLGIACLNMARALSGQGIDIDFVLPYRAKHPEASFMHILPATTLDPLFRYGNGSYASDEINRPIINDKLSNRTFSIRDIQNTWFHCQNQPPQYPFGDLYLLKFSEYLL